MKKPLQQSTHIFTEASRKLDIRVLASQLTFLKVLAERFDFLAKDCCNGLEIIADLCGLRAEDFKKLGMDDEAELLVHLKENLKCSTTATGEAETTRHDNPDEVDVLYRIEFVRIMMKRLIERLESETSKDIGKRARAV